MPSLLIIQEAGHETGIYHWNTLDSNYANRLGFAHVVYYSNFSYTAYQDHVQARTEGEQDTWDSSELSWLGLRCFQEVFVGSCLATKFFIDNLPAMHGKGWVIIKLANDEPQVQVN